MKKLMLALALLSSYAQAVKIEHYDSIAETVIPKNSLIEKLAGGFAWVEGPAWNEAEQHLLFSDIPNNVIHKWKEGEGVTIFMEKSGYESEEPFLGKEPGSNGLAYTQNGELLICEHGNRRVTRLNKDGSKTIIADNYLGRRLNSPNDVIEAADGTVLFTDPPYGLKDWFDDEKKELPFQGVYLWSEGELTLLTDILKAPNGLGISPDGKTLYVSNSDPELPVWYAFDFDGRSVENPRIIANVVANTKDRQGLPDGFIINREGYLFAAGPGGLYVLDPTGMIIAFLDFGHPISNCTWGNDQDTLFVTAQHAVYRIKFNKENKND